MQSSKGDNSILFTRNQNEVASRVTTQTPISCKLTNIKGWREGQTGLKVIRLEIS